jgi:hypothetical protein
LGLDGVERARPLKRLNIYFFKVVIILCISVMRGPNHYIYFFKVVIILYIYFFEVVIEFGGNWHYNIFGQIVSSTKIFFSGLFGDGW